VKRFGIWRYGNGVWHHAGDYGKGPDTFKVLAAAAGKVIFVGWDDWAGNTVIVSHDVGGVADAYRTIYMHLRNGPQNDCEKSWTRSVPLIASKNDANLLASYKQHLNQTGCKENPSQRKPDPAYWGTNSQTIPVSVNKVVKAGALIGYAGMTGPGGQGSPGSPNTHLHIFWTVRDSQDGQWYFFDPYGLYSKPDCYPAGVTDSISGNCARYPIAWKGGKPSYPS
jgi:murein DD-endopeptidase MepM/ murein hydrolase activator NlpD